MQQGYEMDNLQKDPTDPRKHTIYFRINNENLPFPVGGLTTSEYISLKHNDEKAYVYVQNLIKSGAIEDEKIEILYRSIDDVDYNPVNIETQTKPQSSKDKESVMSDDSKNIEKTKHQPRLIVGQSIADCQEKSDCLKNLKNVTQSNISVTKKGTTGYKYKQASRVWNFFEKVTDLTARCTICDKVRSHHRNTTNMIQHLERKHSVLWLAKVTHGKRNSSDASDDSVPSTSDTVDEPKKIKLCDKTKHTKIKDAFERTNSFMDGGDKADKLTNAILYMIAVDKMALTTVENKGFQWGMKTAVPLYKLPSRRTITRLIEARYRLLKEGFIIRVERAICYSLTCDNWTDNANQSYLGVTIHYLTEEIEMKTGCIGVFPLHKNHTAEYLADSLNTVVEQFQLDRSKITAIITDSAANIKLAIEKTIGKRRQLSCFAHILSHIVPDALISIPHAQEIINKVKRIVTIVRRSVVASDQLKSLQIRDGKTEGTVLKLIQDVATRWNSTLYMLNRFLELEQYIYPAISKCDNPPDMLKRDEIQILKDVVSLMKPIENVIVEISGDSYPTCSVIIPLVHCMKSAIYYTKPTTRIGIEFKEKLEDAIENRCKNLENNEIMSISTILDPRFKKLHFEKALAAANAISRIESLLQKNKIRQNMTEKLNAGMVDKDCDNLWSFHDHLVSKNNTNEDLSELRQYLSQPVIERKSNPLQYWKSVKHAFPMLYEQAIKYVSVLGTSVPSERIFSQAGDIKTDERSRLTGEHLNMLLFLGSLAFDDWGLE